ncbi:MAG: hypothetical protein JW751_15100 [Polyangiaceae bacterium]|nr:hypothetical protein [Polyangiaceae bacterium]
MSERRDPIEERLARLAEATDSIRPHPGFEARIADAVAAERAALSSLRASDWVFNVVQSGRLVLAAAALAAGIAVFSAVESAAAYDREAAVAYGTVELGAW